MEKKKKFQMPHTYIIIFGVILFAAILTMFIPLGKYETKEITYTMNGEEKTRTVLDPDSFEYVLDENGNIVIGDEMLTPDSSRFWPADGYEAGHSQPSFDKQFARDWLKANPDNNWTLPQKIVDKTIDKYLQSYEMLTGKKLGE